VSNGETDLAGRCDECVTLVEVEIPPGQQVVDADQGETGGGPEVATVDQDRVMRSREGPRQERRRGAAQVEVARDATPVVVREKIGPDVPCDVEILGKLVAHISVVSACRLVWDEPRIRLSRRVMPGGFGVYLIVRHK
jgi:hypothetical protein